MSAYNCHDSILDKKRVTCNSPNPVINLCPSVRGFDPIRPPQILDVISQKLNILKLNGLDIANGVNELVDTLTGIKMKPHPVLLLQLPIYS